MSEGILLQTVTISITNIFVIIASHLFLNNEIFLKSCLPLDLFKLADVKVKCTGANINMLSCLHIVPCNYIGAIQLHWNFFQNPSIEKWGEPLLKK